MMRKLMAIGLTGIALNACAGGNSPYALNANNILTANGYTNISILDVHSDNCTVAGPFDWNATKFKAKKNGSDQTGFVCGGEVYLMNKN